MFKARIHPLLVAACLSGLSLLPQSATAQTNVPPPSEIFVRGGAGAWLDYPNVFITRRAQKTATAEFDFGTDIDDEGEPLTFSWYVGETLVGQSARLTNEFPQGLQTVHAVVSDPHESASADATIEVILPIDAIRRLKADLEIAGVRERLTHLRPVLRLAEGAIKHARWAGAERQLEVFARRLPRRLDLDNEEDLNLYNRWHDAAEDLWQAVRRIPRHPSTNPGGVFPGPGM